MSTAPGGRARPGGTGAQRVDWGVAFAFESGLSALEERAAVRLFLILALAGLALPLGWTVARGRRWWLAALLTLPPLLPGLLADLYPTSPSPRMAVGEGRFSRSGMAVPSFPGVDVNPERGAVQALEAGGAVVQGWAALPGGAGEQGGEPTVGLPPAARRGPGEDYDLREYRPGDPLRSVHWKLSSKSEHPRQGQGQGQRGQGDAQGDWPREPAPGPPSPCAPCAGGWPTSGAGTTWCPRTCRPSGWTPSPTAC